MVVPTIPKDVGKLLGNVDLFFSFLPICQICVVGSSEVSNLLPKEDNRFVFCHEDTILNRGKLYSFINKRIDNEKSYFRFGWYYQQFLKMAYANICEDEYYLLWDSDTVPVKEVEVINQLGQPVFDYKTEFHKPYFDTIELLFSGLKKQINGSFIAEHMLINVSIMRSLIAEIEKNNMTGSLFCEKIISAIPDGKLSSLSFSEFETYGTYVTKKYPNVYVLRKWKSMRFGGFFYKENDILKKEDLIWLSKHFDAISFEKTDNYTFLGKLVNIKIFRILFPSSILFFLSAIVRGYNKIRRLK